MTRESISRRTCWKAVSPYKQTAGGKFLRKALKSDKPVLIRCLDELYVVDREFLSKEEAKEAYKNKPTDVKFVIPSTVPPLNDATRRLVERAKAEAGKQK